MRNRYDVSKVMRKDDKILVLTDNFSFDADYIHQIPKALAESAGGTIGLSVNRGDECKG